jgi:hypothetical protein
MIYAGTSSLKLHAAVIFPRFSFFMCDNYPVMPSLPELPDESANLSELGNAVDPDLFASMRESITSLREEDDAKK